MPPVRAVAISGSPRAPSKSKTLAEAMLKALAESGCETQLVDLAVMPAEALVAREQSTEIEEAVEAIEGARIVVAASPTYRALYTGVLKCFFDLMPQGALAGKLCIGLQTGIAPQHFLAAEYGFRPLFASLDGTPLAVIYATDAEFSDGTPNEGLLGRMKELAGEAARLAGAASR